LSDEKIPHQRRKKSPAQASPAHFSENTIRKKFSPQKPEKLRQKTIVRRGQSAFWKNRVKKSDPPKKL
jgi:hypothetical protein